MSKNECYLTGVDLLQTEYNKCQLTIVQYSIMEEEAENPAKEQALFVNKMEKVIEIEVKIGDVVQLKSGGPTMTIEDIDDSGNVRCKWFDRDQTLHTESFKLDMLDFLDD